MSDPPFHTPVEDELEAAEAERACHELKGQIARARRLLDQARQVLAPQAPSEDDEPASYA